MFCDSIEIPGFAPITDREQEVLLELKGKMCERLRDSIVLSVDANGKSLDSARFPTELLCTIVCVIVTELLSSRDYIDEVSDFFPYHFLKIIDQRIDHQEAKEIVDNVVNVEGWKIVSIPAKTLIEIIDGLSTSKVH